MCIEGFIVITSFRKCLLCAQPYLNRLPINPYRVVLKVGKGAVFIHAISGGSKKILKQSLNSSRINYTYFFPYLKRCMPICLLVINKGFMARGTSLLTSSFQRYVVIAHTVLNYLFYFIPLGVPLKQCPDYLLFHKPI